MEICIRTSDHQKKHSGDSSSGYIHRKTGGKPPERISPEACSQTGGHDGRDVHRSSLHHSVDYTPNRKNNHRATLWSLKQVFEREYSPNQGLAFPKSTVEKPIDHENHPHHNHAYEQVAGQHNGGVERLPDGVPHMGGL